MAELGDVANDFLREEIEEFVERPDERSRLIEQYARTPEDFLLIAAALVDGDDETVDERGESLYVLEEEAAHDADRFGHAQIR